MQIVSFIIIGIGLLIAYGGYFGIRSGRMEKPQLGSNIREKPPVLEGDAARRQGRLYIAAGIVLIALGVVVGAGNPGVLLSLVGLFGLAGGAAMLWVGWRGIQKRDVVFALTIQNRSHGGYVRSVRAISHRYNGSAAVVVGVGYLLLALGLIGLGVILLFLSHLLVVGVVIGIIGMILWVGSDVIAGRMTPGTPTTRIDLSDL